MGTTPDMGATTAMTEADPTPPEQDPAEPPATDPPAPAEPATGDATLAEIAKLADELGITPGQLKGRLDASRKWEERAKKADAAEEAARRESLSDLERAQEVAKAAEERAARAERKAIALEHGLPADFADRLVGSTPEELAEDAERLKGFMAPQTPATPPPPSGTADGGPQGTPAPTPGLREQIAAAEAAGDFQKSMALKGQLLAEAAGVTAG